MKLFQYVIVSILIHALVWGFFSFGPKASFPASSNQVEIEIIESPKNQQQFVTQPNIKQLQDSLNRLEKKARFLSQETQRVQKEQVASRTGQTRNRNRRQAQPKASPPKEAWTPPSITGPGIQAKRDLQKMSRSRHYEAQVRLSESTISEFIPEVKRGGFTSLNTDQFMFYTFYARINEQIRNRWVNQIRAFADYATPMELQSIAKRRQITQVEVVLSPSGQHVKTLIHKASDSPGLDQAVTAAFLEAQPFNNPPSEIVADDGYIHLHYAFHVQWRPTAFARQ